MTRRAGTWCGAVAALLTAAGLEVRGQPQAGEVSFEVASVRVTPPGSIGLTSISPYGTGRFTATNVTLQLLIELAFGVSESEIVSAPSWIDSQRYDVSVKAAGDAKITYEQLKAPMQALLTQRFHLATRRGSKEMAGYALVAAKGGTKLKESNGRASQPIILPKGLQGAGMSMATLAGMLARVVRRPVVDKTGMTGLYEIKLSYAPENGSDASLPSVFTALQEQLGLKLDSQKVTVETLVIDHVERTPVEN
jgi:uncharacterized protein (TIGR03435 family)